MPNVQRYTPPQTAFGWGIMAFSGFTMLLFSRRSHFAPTPNSMIYPLAASYPSTFTTCWNIQPWVISLAIGIHMIEAFVFHLMKLRKHGVRTFTSVWWQWMASVFVEGLPAFARIDEAAEGDSTKKSL